MQTFYSEEEELRALIYKEMKEGTEGGGFSQIYPLNPSPLVQSHRAWEEDSGASGRDGASDHTASQLPLQQLQF